MQYTIYWHDKWGNEHLANICGDVIFECRHEAQRRCRQLNKERLRVWGEYLGEYVVRD
jgi:hypothetical protein